MTPMVSCKRKTDDHLIGGQRIEAINMMVPPSERCAMPGHLDIPSSPADDSMGSTAAHQYHVHFKAFLT
jgi:hypothetical protein